jgi:target of rapamycin complex 2 subunit MAPKAP1
MLASTSSSTNPFTEFYAAISGRAETESTYVSVFFPRAKKPAGRVMELNVRKDASMEEVLGFALWNYWEEGWLPQLDEGLSGEDDPQWPVVLSAVGWILRIAEEDGEVDEDFPRKSISLLFRFYFLTSLCVYSTRSYGQNIQVQLRSICCSRSYTCPR